MTVFERPGDRVIVLLSSGNLAGTQAVVSLLKQRGESKTTMTSRTSGPRGRCSMSPRSVSDAVRAVERRDGEHLAASATPFNASFIIGGQIKGEPPRLFRTFAEGNFIEAGTDTPFFQTGEAKYGKPIIDRVIGPATNLSDAMKCVLVSFDSTMRSNLSVGMPIDLVCYERDALRISIRHRFAPGDAYFTSLSKAWSEGVRSVFRSLPAVPPPGRVSRSDSARSRRASRIPGRKARRPIAVFPDL